MKKKIVFFNGILVLLLFVLASVATFSQDLKLDLDKLRGLETKARDVVEVNIDGKLLDMAKRVLVKVNDKEARNIGEAIKGLKGIYVRVYNFEKENEYNVGDLDEIRSQLRSPDWEKIANVRSKRNEQRIDVFTRFTGETMSGVAVVLSEAKSIAVVNVVGPIDIDTLVEISGKLNIPKIDIETEKKPKTKNEEER
jgi:enhancing lycopene biosynthesis protein 2